MGLEEFTHKYQAQVALLGIQFKWTMDSEDALFRAKAEKGIMQMVNKKHNARLNELVGISAPTLPLPLTPTQFQTPALHLASTYI